MDLFGQFADGWNYSKARIDDAYRPGGILEKLPSKPSRDPALATLKREDIDLVVRGFLRNNLISFLPISLQVHEFEITRPQAEKALLENGGDVGRTIRALITPTFGGAESLDVQSSAQKSRVLIESFL